MLLIKRSPIFWPLLTLVVAALLIVVSSVAAQAQVVDTGCDSDAIHNTGGETPALCEKDDTPIIGEDGVIVRAARLLSTVVGIAAVIVIIIAGLQYMLATGDSAKINNAKNAILYALIGVVVAVMAQVIIIFVVRSV